jgi:hypothetical protein
VAQHLQPVELRQHQVEDDEVGALGVGDPHRLQPVGGGRRRVAGALQVAGDDLADRRLFVDDEHGAPTIEVCHGLHCPSGKDHPKVKA